VEHADDTREKPKLALAAMQDKCGTTNYPKLDALRYFTWEFPDLLFDTWAFMKASKGEGDDEINKFYM
jgi:hypothetical protein